MTNSKRVSALMIGSTIALLLGSAVPAAATVPGPSPEGPGVTPELLVPPAEDPAASPTGDEPGPAQDLPSTAGDEADPAGPAVPTTPVPDSAEGSTAAPSVSDPLPPDDGRADESLAPAPGAGGPVSNAVPGAQPAKLPANRTVGGTLTFPSDFPASLKSTITVQARWVNNTWPHPQEKACGGMDMHRGSFNTTTHEWSITGLGDCIYTVWVSIPPSPATNNWYWELLWDPRTQRDTQVDLRAGNRTGLTHTVQNRGSVVLKNLLVATKTRDFEDVHQFRAINMATGKEVTPELVRNGVSQYREPANGYLYTAADYAGAALPPGTYKLGIVDPATKLKLWYDGSKGGTTNAQRAKTLTVKAFWGEELQLPGKAYFEFDFQKLAHSGNAFTDVPKSHKFYTDIAWLADRQITTGVKQPNGTVKFLPKQSVTREAMIAFLYRANGVKNYRPKGTSPFIDVRPGDQFYTQIMWAYDTGVTTGTKLPNGQRRFAPKDSITREAMAAFMYRQYASQIPVGTASTRFTDVPGSHKFAREIRWMASNNITTGTRQANGSVRFEPKGATSREATAAFLHRAELKR